MERAFNILVVLIFLCPALYGQRKIDLYISSSGNDKNNGNLDSPYRSFQQVSNRIKQLKSQDSLVNISVNIRGGFYSLNAPLVFYPNDGGNLNSEVIYSAYKNENVVLSGGKKVEGKWNKTEGNVWVIKPNYDFSKQPFASLFINDRRLKRTSSPIYFTDGILSKYSNIIKSFNYNSINSLDSNAFDVYFSFQSIFKNIYNKKDIRNLELIIYHSWEASWHTIHDISSLGDDKSIISLNNPFKYPVGFFGSNERFRIENDLNFLNDPGEWVFDKINNTFYYYAKPGEDPNNLNFYVPFLEKLVTIKGDGKNNKFVRNLSFQNLNFIHCNSKWGSFNISDGKMNLFKSKIPYIDTKDGFTSSQGAPHCGEAILLQSSENVSFINCNFYFNDNYGIRIGEYSKNNMIKSCKFYNGGGGGIILGFNNYDPIGSGVPFLVSPSQNKVIGCTINDCGIIHPSGIGVLIMQANASLISNNTIYNMPYSGISCGWTFEKNKDNYTINNIIEKNVIYDVMKLLVDGGGIYTLGKQSGTVYRKNYIKSIRRTPDGSGSKSNGFFFDEASSDFTVQDNIVEGILNQDYRFNKADSSKITLINNFFEKSNLKSKNLRNQLLKSNGIIKN